MADGKSPPLREGTSHFPSKNYNTLHDSIIHVGNIIDSVIVFELHAGTTKVNNLGGKKSNFGQTYRKLSNYQKACITDCRWCWGWVPPQYRQTCHV